MNAKCATLVVLTLVCLITLVVIVGRERFQEQNISLVKRDKKPCPKGVITVLDHGRLCNQIFEYVSVWVLARRHGLLPFVPNTIHDKLRGLFAHLSIPPLSQLIDSSGGCPKLNKNSLNRASSQDLFDVDDRAIRTNESEDPFVLREYIVLIRFIVPILDEVKEEFRYRPEIVTVAQTRLRWSRSRLEADHGSRETLFVGVHVRRDDYFRAFKAFGVTSYADAGYYRHAVSWMLRKITSETTSAHNIAFVLASDDPAWCKEVLVPELRDEIRAFGNHTNLGKKQGAGLLYLLAQGAGLLVVLGCTGSRFVVLTGARSRFVGCTWLYREQVCCTYWRKEQGAGLLYLLAQGAGLLVVLGCTGSRFVILAGARSRFVGCTWLYRKQVCWLYLLAQGAGLLYLMAQGAGLLYLLAQGAGGSAVFFLGEAETPEVDLVMLSSCNHSIVDYGTYGLWAALLVNGWTVVYDLSALNQHQTIVEINGLLRVAGLMSKWVMLT
uniref:L-Fucosyltransferase n=1 Tax=Timema poppense TaxID=170557 RepID=A0A7R9DPQ8_TIMPO|nr:unnamed protein product [Timema poppensis]